MLSIEVATKFSIIFNQQCCMTRYLKYYVGIIDCKHKLNKKKNLARFMQNTLSSVYYYNCEKDAKFRAQIQCESRIPYCIF